MPFSVLALYLLVVMMSLSHKNKGFSMSQGIIKQDYEKLKNFHRIKSLRDIFVVNSNYSFFEDETLTKIKENINNYKIKEQVRLKKIEKLTKFLERIEYKIKNNS